MFPLLSRVRFRLTEAGYSPRTLAETVKQCRRDSLCRPPVPRSRWPLTHEYSPEARNLIWLPVEHYDEKLDIQHKTTSQQLKCIWLINVWRLYQATVCAWIQVSFLMVMNNGAEAHTTGTQSHFGIFEQKNKKKTRMLIHNLKTCPQWIVVPNKIYPPISKPCITPEPWNRQHENSGNFRGYQT